MPAVESEFTVESAFTMESAFAAAVDAQRAGAEDAVWQILSAVVREPDEIGRAHV